MTGRWKTVALASGMSALAAAGLFHEAAQAPRFNWNELDVQAAPRGNGAHLAVSWRDEKGRAQSTRVAAEHGEPTQRWAIEIRPLEQKNLSSSGHDVWLLGAAAPDPIDLSQFTATSGWQHLYQKTGNGNEGLVAWSTAAPPLKAQIAGGTLLLRFRRHNKGGMAEVTANGKAQIVDLYFEKSDSVTLAWQPELPAEVTGAARWVHTKVQGYPRRAEGIRIAAEPPESAVIRSVRFGGVPLVEVSPGDYAVPEVLQLTRLRATLVSIIGFVLLGLTLFLGMTAWRDKTAAGRFVPWTLALAGAAAVSAFWTAVFFPSLMSPDSMNQWQQAISGKYTTWHPLGMTLVMRAVHVAMPSWTMQAQVAVVAWIQGVLLWCAIFALLDVAVLPRRRKIALCILISLYYPMWLFTVTLWKDVWLAIGLFCLLRWSKPYFMARVWTLRGWVGMVMLLGFALLQRHTAWVSFFALAGFWGLYRLRRLGWHKELRFALLSVAGLAGAFSIQAMVHRIFRAEDAAALLNWTLMYEVAGTAHFSGRPIEGWRSLHSYRAMGKANFEQVARDFTCGGTIDYLVYPPGHALELDDLLRGKYATQDLPGMALGSPGAYLRQRGCSVAHLLGVASVEIPTPHRETIEANRLGISDASLLPRVRTFVLRLEHAAARWFILQIPFRHGLVFLGSGLAVLLMSWGMHRSRNRQTVTYLFAAGFALLCPLLVITPASDWRYLMPANVCWICSILISLASLPYFEPGSARFPAALRREVALGHDEAPVADRGMITGRRR